MQTYKSYSLPFIRGFFTKSKHMPVDIVQMPIALRTKKIEFLLQFEHDLNYHNIENISLVPPQQ